ncbi:MAG TPA: hypothetical protein VEZ90_14120 [Blastocatellia bacterium]|nr:hypothetical protein [Blastocatellia bacterium]
MGIGMNIKRMLFGAVIALGLVFTTACFNIEQEVFLNPDGSGEAMISLSLPDLPEDVTGKQGGIVPKSDPASMLDALKSAITSKLPPTVKVKEARAVQQNGSMAWFAVFEFKNLSDLGPALTDLGLSKTAAESATAPKDSTGPDPLNGNIRCSLDVRKIAEKTIYTERLLLENPKPAGSAQGGKGGKETEAQKVDQPKSDGDKQEAGSFDDFGKQLAPLIMGAFHLRFVLHTPTPITESNADVVLHGNTAIWNCTLLGFMKDKKSADNGTRPIEMRAAF